MSDDSAVEAARRIVATVAESDAMTVARALLSSQSQVERMREALEAVRYRLNHEPPLEDALDEIDDLIRDVLEKGKVMYATDQENLQEIAIYHYGTHGQREDQNHRFNGLSDAEMAAAIEDIARRALATIEAARAALTPKE